MAGALLIPAAVAALGWVAPAHAGRFTRGGKEIVVVWLVLVIAAPTLLRLAGRAGGLVTSVAAGFGWGWVGLGTALVDAALADRRWMTAAAWGVCVGIASWGTLLAEMTALQTWPATRAIPIAFGLEMVAPAAAAPALTTHGA